MCYVPISSHIFNAYSTSFYGSLVVQMTPYNRGCFYFRFWGISPGIILLCGLSLSTLGTKKGGSSRTWYFVGLASCSETWSINSDQLRYEFIFTIRVWLSTPSVQSCNLERSADFEWWHPKKYFCFSEKYIYFVDSPMTSVKKMCIWKKINTYLIRFLIF